MRLRSSETLGGVPVLEVRALIRRWYDGAAPLDFIGEHLELRRAERQRLLAALLEEGLLTREEGDPVRYELTVKAHAFAQATAAAPLRRSTADTKLRELVARMVHANASAEFLVGVESAYVYGSYLTDVPRLGDLDVSLTLWRKEPDGERFTELSRAAARKSGRRFGTFIDFLSWPDKQLLLFLKQRARVYSLHQDEPLLQNADIPRRAIVLERRPVA
jgi:hypothetical protein